MTYLDSPAADLLYQHAVSASPQQLCSIRLFRSHCLEQTFCEHYRATSSLL